MNKDGLLLVDKESGITSHDAVARVRRAAGIRKIGHTGTLDPLATGLLVLCIGGATRLQSYLTGMDKAYEGEIRFGWATDTYDAQGEPQSEQVDRDIESVDFEPLLEPFRGEIEQVPPAFSAKKVGGERAYKLARKGQTPELEPKPVRIDELEILEKSGSTVRFRVACSAGTYVRSIAHELGEAVGVGAHLASLRRTAIGDFRVEDALRSDQLGEIEEADVFAEPHFRTFREIRLPFDNLMVDPLQESKLVNGQTVVAKPQEGSLEADEMVSVLNVGGELIAIARVKEVLRENGGPVVIQPKVVLKRNDER
ncbi:MAG: tRNA pseudouridine(55) synthase TruB [Thermoanaerobaculia bacterium]|nr:tRNA pseudouridine(55) synthase TruB [Thermoanaerobaculia bacterium]